MGMHNIYPAGAGWGVVELSGDRGYQAVFRIEARDWRELIPGYMHIRIDRDMLVSRSSEPGNDIVERDNRF
jgi:macrolide transport system ATP-binding/permease protein/lipoprotein-releasing system ATP-binding protein